MYMDDLSPVVPCTHSLESRVYQSQVLVDPPGPFALLPTSQLESSGNSVMRMMLGVLQKTFISELAKDYDRFHHPSFQCFVECSVAVLLLPCALLITVNPGCAP